MTEPSNPTDKQSTEARDDEVSLLDLFIVVAKHKKFILGLSLFVAVLALAISVLMPNIYTGTTTILPPQQSQSGASAMLAQIGGLAGLAGGAAGLKNPNDIYVAMLKSRTVAGSLIKRFSLMKLWKIDIQHPSDAYKALANVTNIAAEKDGTITIAVDDEDAVRSAELANAYVDELVKFTSVLAVTEASQRRLFFERQFALAKDNLSKAEAAARQALQTDGLVKVDDQGRAMVENTARLRGQITVKEVQIGAMRTFAADRNPDLQLAEQELAALKRALAKIEGTEGTKSATNSQSGHGSESLRLLREVKYNEVVYELLAKQFELAKIDEAKDSSFIQVIDKAIKPDRKSKPRRALIVLFSTLVAGAIGVLLAFVREAAERAKHDPQQAEQIERLKAYLRTGRRSCVRKIV